MEWKDQVQLHFGDMRTLELPEKIDILITELLGSFGDNELSPECLDGAVRFLKREHICVGFLLFPRLKFRPSQRNFDTIVVHCAYWASLFDKAV